MMIKEWFIQIEGHKEGPFSIEDLKRDDRITPDVLAWKQGFSRWIPIGKIPELRDLFKDTETKVDSEEEKNEQKLLGDSNVIALQYEPFQIWLWFLIIFLVLFYTVYKFYLAQ